MAELLGRRGVDDAVMAQHAIAPIDLLVVNLYPFAATVARPGCRYADAVENIDIGGPAMLRAAAKTMSRCWWSSIRRIIRCCSPSSIPTRVAVNLPRRARLAAKAFSHIARYDALVAGYLSSQQGLPVSRSRDPVTHFEKVQDLRYGENPHQSAALYRDPAGAVPAWPRRACCRARTFRTTTLPMRIPRGVRTAVHAGRLRHRQHANPCGVAVAATALRRLRGAYRTDPTSPTAASIAFNRELDAATATAILERQFVEVLAAPPWPPGRARAGRQPNVGCWCSGSCRRSPAANSSCAALAQDC